MLHKTRGIVFKYFKYRDTSIIVKIFTEAFGIQTYIVNGVRSKSSKGKIALYQPLTLLDMVVYHKPNTDIHRISEIKCTAPFHTIPGDIRKTTIAIFMAEVLYKSVKDEGEVADLFEFIHHSLMVLDHLDAGYENFHLQFLLKLTPYLGIGIGGADQFFNTLPNEQGQHLQDLLIQPYQILLKLSSSYRSTLLDVIIDFYKRNIEELKALNSIKVLHEVFH